jgi:hypothetical protein
MNRVRAAAAVWAAAMAAGCGSRAVVSALPEQRGILPPIDFERPHHFLSMTHPHVDRFAVRDIHPAEGGAPWRWTGRNPTVRLRVSAREGLRIRADFVTAQESFAHTGPLTVRVRLNGCVAAVVKCDAEGEYRVNEEAPLECLERSGEQQLGLELDKAHRAPDGRVLGVILLRMGFTD